jgi:hypothetical protein
VFSWCRRYGGGVVLAGVVGDVVRDAVGDLIGDLAGDGRVR